MKVGLLPLFVAVVVAAARVSGSTVAADVFATLYLVVATLMISRPQALTSPSRI